MTTRTSKCMSLRCPANEDLSCQNCSKSTCLGERFHRASTNQCRGVQSQPLWISISISILNTSNNAITVHEGSMPMLAEDGRGLAARMGSSPSLPRDTWRHFSCWNLGPKRVIVCRHREVRISSNFLHGHQQRVCCFAGWPPTASETVRDTRRRWLPLVFLEPHRQSVLYRRTPGPSAELEVCLQPSGLQPRSACRRGANRPERPSARCFVAAPPYASRPRDHSP
jgi:hypothetical protein